MKDRIRIGKNTIILIADTYYWNGDGSIEKGSHRFDWWKEYGRNSRSVAKKYSLDQEANGQVYSKETNGQVERTPVSYRVDMETGELVPTKEPHSLFIDQRLKARAAKKIIRTGNNRDQKALDVLQVKDFTGLTTNEVRDIFCWHLVWWGPRKIAWWLHRCGWHQKRTSVNKVRTYRWYKKKKE